ncbi:ornithine decarboxylase-like protein, partial [Dinothrombium tinctorium]
ERYKKPKIALNASDEPFYIADLDDIINKHQQWITKLSRVKPFYAVKNKLNENVNVKIVLQMITALGLGFDCSNK